MLRDATASQTTAARPSALQSLLAALADRHYAFVTITPASHARVVSRAGKGQARDLRDVFGWSLPFARDLLEPDLWDILAGGNLVEPASDGLLRSAVRVSSLGGHLYAHSAYPTDQEDAVFFGPDSYRFADLIERELAARGAGGIGTVVDIGTGAGVGAITAKTLCPAARVIGTDVNPAALRFAAVNAAAAGVAIETIVGDTRRPLGFPIDLVIANPPYIVDAKSRAYRDGGDLHGAEVAINMVADMLPQLSDAGVLILYTGSAIVNGHDGLRAELETLAAEHGRRLRYRSLDPDVFGEELAGEEYRTVERIELIAAVFEPAAA